MQWYVQQSASSRPGNRSTSTDNMKHSFAKKIKQSSHFLTNPGCSNPITTNEKGVTPTSTLMPLKEKGWAIPKWKKFRYSETQKNILMKYFEEGEQTGIKEHQSNGTVFHVFLFCRLNI